MTTLLVLVALLVVLDLIALGWGADSRLPGGDWQRARFADRATDSPRLGGQP